MAKVRFLKRARAGHSGSMCPFAYTTLLVLLLSVLSCHNRLCYANGGAADEIDETPSPRPQPQLELQHNEIRDTSLLSSDRISFSNHSLLNSYSNQSQRKHDRIRRNSILGGGGGGSGNLGGLLANNFSPVPQPQQQQQQQQPAVVAPAATAQQQNLEGLLASCQLTNLLLYQLVNNQQQQHNAAFSPAAAAGLLAAPAAPSPFLSPFNPYLQPAAAASNPFLTTYTTTSTYTTKMTSTDVITIPLLFGNKPVPTTVTRTKTYDVTTSTELTLTSTIVPTTTTTTIIQVAPTKVTKFETEGPIEPPEIGGHYENSLNGEDTASTSPSSTRSSSKSKKKRKNRPSSSSSSQQKQGRRLQYQDELESAGLRGSTGTSPAYKYGQREKQQLIELKNPSGRGSTKFRRQYVYEDGASQLENPDYYIADYFPSEVIHHNQQRLKRRGEVEADSFDSASSREEFVLEPSFDSSSSVQLTEECPATTTETVTLTVTATATSTKTVTKTKLVNPATALVALVKESDALQSSNNINYEATNRAKTNFISSRPKGRSDRRSAGASSSDNGNASGIGTSGSGSGSDNNGFSSSRTRTRSKNKGRSTTSGTSTTERSNSASGASKERRRQRQFQRSTTLTPSPGVDVDPDVGAYYSSTNNYYGSNLNPNTHSVGNRGGAADSDINSRRSRSRFHANYYAGRASY